MKKAIFPLMALLCINLTGFTQSNTPVTVTSAFKQKFPNAKSVKWNKENAHEYEASFELDAAKYSANFSNNGDWLETESPVSFDQLPEKVQKVFNVSHKSTAIMAVSKIETAKRITKYEIEIKEGKKTVELFYLADGASIKE